MQKEVSKGGMQSRPGWRCNTYSDDAEMNDMQVEVTQYSMPKVQEVYSARWW
jgi:hypothetical protein